MGSPYQSQSVSGYNSSPPPDDGSTTAANKISWATIKTKITDPLNTFCAAINTALRSALNVSPSTTGVLYTTVKADHLTTVEATGTFTVSLGDAASMIADAVGYIVAVYNKGTGAVTVGVVTATNTLAGQTNGTVTLQPGQAMTFTVAQSGVGYDIISATGFAPFVLTGAAGTNTVTAAAPANLIALYSGLQVVISPANTNTGATTLAITPSGGAALTAKNVFFGGAASIGGELKASTPAVLEYDGTQFNVLTPVSGRPTVKVFTATGTDTVPSWCRRVKAYAKAAGASGGGSSTANGNGGGGGEGEERWGWFTVTPGATITATLNSAGVAIALNTNASGNNGGTTVVTDGTFTVTASGGLGGVSGNSGGAGGLGGPAGTGGDYGMAGDAGQVGATSAATAAINSNGGGKGAGAFAAATAAVANSGGGGGGGSTGSASGAGAKGIAIVEYWP